jgi:hypothetical protein
LQEAYCHNGHDLISTDVLIYGESTIKLLAKNNEVKTYIYISTKENDNTIKADKIIKEGSILELLCPICEEELDNIAPCLDGKGKYLAIYLDKKRNFSNSIGICNCWGNYKNLKKPTWQIIYSTTN